MNIRLKSNINLRAMSSSGGLCFLVPFEKIMGYDESDTKYNGYTYVLPWKKTNFTNFAKGQDISVYVEKIDIINKRVYVSQIHWLYMRNIIKDKLGLDVKILKRYLAS